MAYQDKIEINIFTLSEDTSMDSHPYNEVFTSLEDAHDFAKTLDTQFEGQDSNILINHYQLNNLSKIDLMEYFGYDVEDIDEYELKDLIIEWAEDDSNNYNEYLIETIHSVEFNDYSKIQESENRQSIEADENKKELIKDFEERFKEYIHYSEYAGYGGVSYYAVLLLSPSNELIKNKEKLFGVQLSEREKIDYKGNELVNLGNRISRDKTNFNPENAVIQIRISDHPQKHESEINDASLSIVLMPEHQLISPYSQEAYEGKGLAYNTDSIGYDIHSEYIVAVDSESETDSYIDDKMIWDWVMGLDYEELIENRQYDYFEQGGLADIDSKHLIYRLKDENGDWRFLKKAGEILFNYNGYDFVIKSKRGYKNKIDTVYLTLTQRPTTSFNYISEVATEDLSDEEIVDLIEEALNNEIDYYQSYIKDLKHYKEKIRLGYKNISPYQMKIILYELVPEYIGYKHEAKSGSEYILVNGKELRVSDHERPYNSKWNLIHGDYENILYGLLNYDDVKEYIEELINKEISSDSKQKLKKMFENSSGSRIILKNGGETSCGCGNKSLKKENMKTGDFIVKKEYEHSDDRFAIIKELSDVHVVLDVYEYSKNVGTSQAPIDYLQNYRLANDEEIQSYKEMLSEDNENFNLGGEVKRVDYTWENLPITFKVDKRPTLRKVKFDLKDNNLRLLTNDFVGKDEFRPVMGGVLFDDTGVVVLDAHKVAVLPFGSEESKIRGVYNLHDKKQKITGVAIGKEIDGKFPNYKVVHPTLSDNKKTVVDLAKLKIYTNALVEGFSNQTTKQVRYLFDGEVFSFNGKFMIECIDFLLSLGHEYADLYYSMPTRAVIFLPEKGKLYKDPSVLLMPVWLEKTMVDENDVKNININGAEEIDYGYAFHGVYSINENAILYRDKKYEIEKGISNKQVWDSYEISLNDFKELKKLAFDKSVNILNYCKLSKNSLQQTNISFNDVIDVFIFDVKLQGEGIYRYTELGVLYDNLMSEQADDYPILKTAKDSITLNPHKIKINDYLYFQENIKYALKVALKDDFRQNVSQVFFETKGDDLLIKSTDANNIFSNRLKCESSSETSFKISSDINSSLFSIIDSPLDINVLSDEGGDTKSIHFASKNKAIFIVNSDNEKNKIQENLKTYISKEFNKDYAYELIEDKAKLIKIFNEIIALNSYGEQAKIYKEGNSFKISIDAISYDLNVKNTEVKRKHYGFFTYNSCSSNDMVCLTYSNMDNFVKNKFFEKEEVKFLFNFDNKVNYFDCLNIEFDKHYSSDAETIKNAEKATKKPKKEDKNIQETSLEKIQRFKEEIEGYNDLIELAKDDVLDGAKQISAYKEMIEGLELLIELEQDSNPNFEKPIAVIKQVDFEVDKNKFIDYVLGFYGKEGVYADDYKGGFSREQVEMAVEQYLKDPETNWGDGDSVDREFVRDRYLVPLLDDMDNDSGLLTEKEEKEMIEQKLLNKEWDIVDDYNRNYMNKYGFYGSDEFLKNFPVIEDVLIKSDEMIGKVFVAEDGANQIVGKKLHPTGNDYEIKRLNTNAIYLISEDAIEQFIKLMEKSTTEEYKQEKRFTDMIDELKKDDKFLNEALDYMLHESPYGVIEEHYIHGAEYKNILKRFLEMNNISIPQNKTYYLGHLIDGIKAKYYLRNKQEVLDLLGSKATDGLMNTIWGKKYRYKFGNKQLILNRKQFMDLKLKQGYIVEGEKPNRKLRNPSENSYYSEADLTRAEFDYAESLYLKKMKEENALKEKQEEEKRKQEEEEEEIKKNIEKTKSALIENSFFTTVEKTPLDKNFKLVFVKINPDLTTDLDIASYYAFGNKYKKMNFQAVDLKAIEKGLLKKVEGSEEIISKSDLEKKITDYMGDGIVFRFDDLKKDSKK